MQNGQESSLPRIIQTRTDYTKTVLVDMDGVLADMVEKVLRMYDIFYGVRLTHDDITEYSIHKSPRS